MNGQRSKYLVVDEVAKLTLKQQQGLVKHMTTPTVMPKPGKLQIDPTQIVRIYDKKGNGYPVYKYTKFQIGDTKPKTVGEVIAGLLGSLTKTSGVIFDLNGVFLEGQGSLMPSDLFRIGQTYRVIMGSEELFMEEVTPQKGSKRKKVPVVYSGKFGSETMEPESTKEDGPLFVHVTELVKGADGCQRSQEYKLKGVPFSNPKRWPSVRGTVIHQFLERFVKTRKFGDEEIAEILLPVLKEMQIDPKTDLYKREIEDLLLPMLAKEIANLLPYLNEAIKVETEYNIKLEMEDTLKGRPVVLTGTMDLVLTNQDGSITVIDYKTGQKAMPDHQSQVNLYMHMLEAQAKGTKFNPAEIHYLGKPDQIKTVKVPMKPVADVESQMKEFLASMEQTVDIIQTGEHAPCKESFMCLYCPWMGNPCRGI